MCEVDILLAAYNGEKFIAEQIDSILAQTFQDFRIIIRDDNSTDNTPVIIKEYAKKYPDKIKIIHDDAICKSPAKNFMELIKYASAGYVIFSDQDDYWLPYKIQVTLWHMKLTEQKNINSPVLVFSGMQVVDENLCSLGISTQINIPEKRYSLKELLAMNCAAGCTIMINRKLYENLGGYSDEIIIHDWFIMLYASAFGVIKDAKAVLMLYRQHENNVIGAAVSKYKRYRGFKKLLMKLKRPVIEMKEAAKRFHKERDFIELFKTRYSSRFSQEQLKIIDEHLQLFSKNKISRLIALYKLDCMFYKGALQKIKMLIKILFF